METRLKRITFKKLRLDQHQPLPKDAVSQLEDWLRVELTYSSNAIEGNTLTRLETAEIIEKGVAATVGAKPLRDQLEAINHAKALDFIKSLARSKQSHQRIAEDDILAIHKIILAGIDDKWAGRYRQSEVFVKGATVIFPLPQNVPYQMDEFIQWLETQQEEHPVRVAADAHFKLVTIHPFVDGNGRTARLLMNLILLINSYPMAVIRNEDRVIYLEAVNKGQTKNDLMPFYAVVEKAVERSLNAYLAAARGKSALAPLTVGTKSESGDLFKIGELAKETGETIHTLRYWTSKGLLRVARLTPGGYQLYAPTMIGQAKKIRYLQKIRRLTLDEIRRKLERAA
jgi:Fic family protein